MLPISRCRARLREYLGEIKRRRAQSGALGWKAQFEIDDLDERMISPRGVVAGAVSSKVAGTFATRDVRNRQPIRECGGFGPVCPHRIVLFVTQACRANEKRV
jgi:hypothetical protein